MKKVIALFMLMWILPFFGCGQQNDTQIVATTKPVYDFTSALCQDTGLSVSLLVTEQLSCLHDYTLQVKQMRAVESAEAVVLSGAGLESFLDDALHGAKLVIDSSKDIEQKCGHLHNEGHQHDGDPHIWLSVENARIMSKNICEGLSAQYPGYKEKFQQNLSALNERFDKLDHYGKEVFSQLDRRELITFHDGFSYFADYWGLHILHALEEESGSEASASELKELTGLIRTHQVKAIFTEENGSTSAAATVARETGIPVYWLTMGMSDKDYFTAMYHNIDTIKEALA